MLIKNHSEIRTLGQLKNTGYKPRSIKDEMRENLIKQLQNNENSFHGIVGYEQSVIPDIDTSILSRHNILLLGLRGQAKTRLARLMINLLDEYIPVVEGSELNDDPFDPISRYSLDLIKEHGDDTPISWMHRSERYTEKLATPDVSIADLIGDVDPIKAANMKLPYSDERVIHFGLIPRSHRGIFVINELPDLQARIQVALFNILQEKDIQIRGFKIRLPLDIQFVFTANPEDYTNRGAIVTPLKDRIDSQILTHYPKSIHISKEITSQEAKLTVEQAQRVCSSELVKLLVEQIAFEARESEYIDAKSGVSARLTISAYENLVSAAERRLLINKEKETHIRISDFAGVIPSITGKIELVYEGEQEGPAKVAQILVGKAIRSQFSLYFPNPDKLKRNQDSNPYLPIINWFGKGNQIDLMNSFSNAEYKKTLTAIPGLKELVNKYHPNEDESNKLLLMEFILHGLSEYSLLSKFRLEKGLQFKDMLSSMFSMNKEEDEDLNNSDTFI
ncbi:MAG: sigma 54-interacting transcriptional regulator [Ignavibacteria bacterium]|nr:sigma 54-interacting transcriptional regulator [Ignavibacteria bacterium]MCU7499874.1 sigma 54-interacting transcriptional regulator [Ignavibacteria bacterium]MCU7519972.1 sigma 54-interacting transcriptional regulator [Ignavibacteria bacterium]MCU7523047.1 sigma 54-interacting transcriptional regulator [Ignavibacteria bacterium]